MSKFKMDAVEIASSIHKGDFSKLRGKSFEMCDNKNMQGKYTLNQIGDMVVKITTRLDNLENRVDAGFKQVNSRIDNLEKDINTRLDYIVKANNLKDLPKSK